MMPILLSRRDLLRVPLVLPAANLLAQTGAAGRRLNVLMIAVDDLNNRIGCYGDPVVKTPNIDRLAARGVRFDRAYCNYPLCNPSRTSLLSGRRPDTTQVLDNSTPPRTHLGSVTFLPEYFRENGYFTARVGKIAHGLFEHEVKWDISESAAGRAAGPEAAAAKKQQRAAKKEGEGEGGNRLAWTATDRDDADEPDGRTARRIAQLLSEKRDKPFFIGCGFHKPHLAWIAPKKYFDMYPPDRIQLPQTPPNDRDDIPPIALTRGVGDDELTDDKRRQAIAAYHAATTFMDAQLGVVLDTVDRLKLWENTVVLLFGDHGWHLNEHLGLWRKMTLFEESTRAPMIVAAPGRKRAVSPRFVEFVDMYPSLVELCGLRQPEGLEGTSFVPLLDRPDRTWKKAAFTVVKHGRTIGRTVRTERYRYTEWGGPDVAELYDERNDPKEFTNLVNDAKHEAPKGEMAKLLRDGWKAALPPK